MIRLSLLLMTLAATLPSSAQADTDLFRSLDQNADGKVSQDEIPESQQSFFRRALRVADQDGDGTLTVIELTAALTDAPLSQPGNNPMPFARRTRPGSNPNLRLLDRNKDGQLSLDEVPEPLKPRLQQIIDRTGEKSVSIELLERLSGTAANRVTQTPPASDLTPGNQTPDSNQNAAKQTDAAIGTESRNDTESKVAQPSTPMADPRPNGAAFFAQIPAGLLQNFDQADANQDGGIDREELRRALRVMSQRPRD